MSRWLAGLAGPLLSVTIGLSAAVSLEAAAEPRVRVVATGGTISNHASGRLSGAALVHSVKGLSAIARVEAETFSNVSSIELTLADWLRLSRRLNELLGRGEADGVVVTSGSDTLEELAWWLDLTVAGDRPIVVTGAMRRPSDSDADGPRNLEDAARVAADGGARRRGALVVMAGRVLRARDAAKQSLSPTDAFISTGETLAGRIDGGRVRFVQSAPPSRAPVFDPAAITSLPRVDLLLTYQQAPGDSVDAALRGGAKGLVFAAAGAGALTAAQIDAADAARRAGVPIVVASRVARGTLTAADVPKGTIPSGTLSAVKSRILLMLLLARGDPAADIPANFRKY